MSFSRLLLICFAVSHFLFLCHSIIFDLISFSPTIIRWRLSDLINNMLCYILYYSIIPKRITENPRSDDISGEKIYLRQKSCINQSINQSIQLFNSSIKQIRNTWLYLASCGELTFIDVSQHQPKMSLFSRSILPNSTMHRLNLSGWETPKYLLLGRVRCRH